MRCEAAARSCSCAARARAKGEAQSNILWNYGHTTIPRHLRDIYVTEYGSADLRGKSDEECTIAMLALCDARFVDALAERAKADGKLRREFPHTRSLEGKHPERLKDALKPMRRCLPLFPFGSDFTSMSRRFCQHCSV